MPAAGAPIAPVHCGTDGTYTSNTATVTITVNSTPLANNDVFTTQMGPELDTSVWGDVSDPDGNGLNTVLVTEPAHW